MVRITVLVVDDHRGFRVQARLLLEEAGYDVVGEAGTGADAIESALQLRPDVVLLDVGLPDRDGFSVARVLHDSALPTVLVSGRDASDFGPRITECGAVGFVAKADLTALSLDAVLSGSRGR